VTDVARQLDLTRVVVPRVAAVLSAWGMLATDLRFEVSRTHIGDTARLDGAAIKRLFAEMEQEGFARLRVSFDGPVHVQRSVEMRYGEQIFEITVPLHDIDWSVSDPLPQIVARFHDRHEELYTYALREQDAVLVNARAAVIGVLPGVPQEPVLPARDDAAPVGERSIWLRGWTSVPVYAFDALAPGQAIAGPAIVESAMTTVLLRPSNRAIITPHGWLDIDVG
jgi:N-methylhydantoinase A